MANWFDRAFEKSERQHSRTDAKNATSVVFVRSRWHCEGCGCQTKEILQVHHLVPVREGGAGTADNLALLCPNCHAVVGRMRKYPDFFETSWIRHLTKDQIAKLRNMAMHGIEKPK